VVLWRSTTITAKTANVITNFHLGILKMCIAAASLPAQSRAGQSKHFDVETSAADLLTLIEHKPNEGGFEELVPIFRL